MTKPLTPMSPEEAANLIRTMRGNSDFIIQAISIQAPLLRAKFNALVKEGFTETQALELCKSQIIQ